MSSDVTQSTRPLHPLLRQAMERARALRTPVVTRIPAPRPLDDAWDVAQQALQKGVHATVWSDPDQDMLAVGVHSALQLTSEGETRLTTLDAKFQEIQTVRSEEHTSELQSRGHLVCR